MTQPPDGVGTAHPAWLQQASPGMNWTVLCQARRDTNGDGKIAVKVSTHGTLEGDRLERFFILGDGAGYAIDTFAGADPSGRYVAIVRNRRLSLVDTVSGKQSDLSTLGADIRSDQSSHVPHRAVSFDSTGKRMAYVRHHGERQWVVVRNLESGQETVLNPGAGLLWRLSFEPDAQFIRLDMVVSDSNGNRQLQWPYPVQTGTKACRGPIPFFNIWEFPGDQPDVKLLRLSDRKLLQPRGFVATVGDAIITRSDTGELWLELPGPERRQIASEQCAGRVYHVDASQGAILLGCSTAYGGRRDMFLRTPHARIKLGFDLAGFEVDGRLDGYSPLVPVYPRNDSALVDLTRNKVVNLRQKTRVLGLLGHRALVSVGNRLRFLTIEASGHQHTIKRQGIRPPKPTLATIYRAGSMISVGNLVFDLADQRYVGQLAGRPLAISASGMGLLPANPTAPTDSALPLGPFRWTKATPKPPTKVAGSK